MKVSVKLQEDHHDPQNLPLRLRAKLPVSIFNLPFLSHFTTSTVNLSQLSLAISTNLSSGPSLKLSYATAESAAASASFAVTLKSGTGLFGSPKNSPLVISANFSYNPSNPNNPNPTFSLLFKPQLGAFSLRKSTHSHSKSDIGSADNQDSAVVSSSFAFVLLDKPTDVRDFPPAKKDNDSIFNGIQLAARTQLPVTKKVALNFRWLAKVPQDSRVVMPILQIDKIGIQRVADVLEVDKKKQSSEDNSSELEILKSVCYWMKRELDVLSRVNKDMKSELEEMKIGNSSLNSAISGSVSGGDFAKAARKRTTPASTGFQEWKSKRGVLSEENKKKEEKNGATVAIDMENEFQKAIKAATASP